MAKSRTHPLRRTSPVRGEHQERSSSFLSCAAVQIPASDPSEALWLQSKAVDDVCVDEKQSAKEEDEMTIDIIELDQQSRHLVPDHVDFGDVRSVHSDQHISPSTYILFLRSSNLHPIAPNSLHYLI